MITLIIRINLWLKFFSFSLVIWSAIKSHLGTHSPKHSFLRSRDSKYTHSLLSLSLSLTHTHTHILFLKVEKIRETYLWSLRFSLFPKPPSYLSSIRHKKKQGDEIKMKNLNSQWKKLVFLILSLDNTQWGYVLFYCTNSLYLVLLVCNTKLFKEILHEVSIYAYWVL